MAGFSDLYTQIPEWTQEELNRRSEDRSYIQQTRSSWVRATSNFETSEGGRKILMGGDVSKEESFRFGFSSLYESDGAIPPKRPVPGITDIDIQANDWYLEGTINWKAWSIDQLEELMPFFMNPGISVFLEIGWSDMDASAVIDPLDINNTILPFYKGMNKPSQSGESAVRNYKEHPRFQKMREAEGNYFIFPGMVYDFSFSMNQQGGFDCTTKIQSIAESTYRLSLVNNKNSRKHTVGEENAKPILDKIQEDLEFQDFEEQKPPSGVSSGKLGVGSIPSTSNDQPSSETPQIHGGENYPSSYRIGPNYYLSWAQIETIFNQAFKLVKDQDSGSGNSPNLEFFALNSFDSQISYWRGEVLGRKVSLKSDDLNVCLINGGESAIQTANGKKIEKFDSIKHPMNDQVEQDVELGFKNGRAGWLYNLYVSTKTFKEAITTNNSYFEAIRYMLDKCSGACHEIWKFEIAVERETNTAFVIDEKHPFQKPVQDIEPYNFQVYSKSSQIRDFSLDSDLEDQVVQMMAAQNMVYSNKDQPIINDRSDASGQFFKRYEGKDLVLENLRMAEDNENTEEGGEEDKENKERQQKSVDSDDRFYTDANVPKSTEISELEEKRADDNADWVNEKFLNTVYPTAFQIVSAEKGINADVNDGSAVNANAIIDVNISLTMTGIAGFRMFQTFKVEHIPEFYRDKGLFVVESVRHNVQGNDWTTTVSGRYVVGNMYKENINSENP